VKGRAIFHRAFQTGLLLRRYAGSAPTGTGLIYQENNIKELIKIPFLMGGSPLIKRGYPESIACHHEETTGRSVASVPSRH
jgi:hypothetical protein